MEHVVSAAGWLIAEGGEGAATHESATMPILPYYPELIFGIVCFIIIFAIAAKMFVPAMEKAYTERRDAIEGDMSRAENALAEAEGAGGLDAVRNAMDAALGDVAAYAHERALQSLRTPRS